MILQRFVKAVQDQTVLDRVADPAQPPLKHVFRNTNGSRRILKNVLSGTWIGHPLHPILKDVPIGGWTMAAIFDALAGSDAGMQRAADVSIIFVVNALRSILLRNRLRTGIRHPLSA